MNDLRLFRRITSDDAGGDNNWLVFDTASDNIVVLTPVGYIEDRICYEVA